MASIISWHVLRYYNRNGYRSAYGDDSIDSKEEMMGRVMSLLMLSSMGFIPLSYAFTSIALAIGIPIVTIMKSGAIAVIVFVLFVAIRVPVVRKFD